MGVKTAGVGHFAIPTAPAAGTSVTSGAANVFTTTAVQLIASTAASLYITGVHLEAAAAKAATYIYVQLMIGAAGVETVIGQYLVPLSTGSTVALGYRQIYPFIPVAAGVRISAKTADSVGAAATLVTLECIAQSNVVDDGITVGTVALVNTLTTYTGNTPQTGDSFARLGAPVGASHSADVAAVKVDTAAVKVKTDFLPSVVAGGAGGVFIAGSNAATTVNVTGNLSGSVGSVTGAVGSVTAAVVLPAIPANWITAAGIAAAALNGKGDWLLSSAYTAPDNASIATLIARLTAARATNLDNLDAAISSRSTYAGGDTAGTTTLLGRLTAGRATNLDNLDAAVSTRSTYAGGDTPGTTTLLTRVDVTLSTRLAASGYTAPDNAGIAAIKVKTDGLTFNAGNVLASIEAIRGNAFIGTPPGPFGV